jgi:hypothetical protein
MALGHDVVTMEEVQVPAIVLHIEDLKAVASNTTSYKLTGYEESTAIPVTEQFGGAVLAYTGNAATMNYHGPTENILTLALLSVADTNFERYTAAVPFRWRG